MIPEEQLKGMITSADRQLLWDIRELLRGIVAAIKPQEVTPELVQPTREATEAKVYPCKHHGCREVLPNKGAYMAHMKKPKKEGK